jgi:hypothetical protein
MVNAVPGNRIFEMTSNGEGPQVINALAHPNPSVREASLKTAEVIAQLVPLFVPGSRITIFVRKPGEPDKNFFMTSETDPDMMLLALASHLKTTQRFQT